MQPVGSDCAVSERFGKWAAVRSALASTHKDGMVVSKEDIHKKFQLPFVEYSSLDEDEL